MHNVNNLIYCCNGYEFQTNGFYGSSGRFGVRFHALKCPSSALICAETWNESLQQFSAYYSLIDSETKKLFLAHGSAGNGAFGDGHVGPVDRGFVQSMLKDSGITAACSIYDHAKTKLSVN